METFRKSIMAGIAISLGCIVNLHVGGTAGAVLFTFGLLTVVHYQLPLYTGQAGFVSIRKIGKLTWILLGNVIGCFVSAMLTVVAFPELVTKCQSIVDTHLGINLYSMLILGIGCGFVMTTAVEFAKRKQYLPLLFGVPLFILCKFQHSIADAFYYLCSFKFNFELLNFWIVIVVGNYLGCNAYKLFINCKND